MHCHHVCEAFHFLTAPCRLAHSVNHEGVCFGVLNMRAFWMQHKPNRTNRTQENRGLNKSSVLEPVRKPPQSTGSPGCSSCHLADSTVIIQFCCLFFLGFVQKSSLAHTIRPQLICLIEINNYIGEKKISESAENEKVSPHPPKKMYL